MTAGQLKCYQGTLGACNLRSLHTKFDRDFSSITMAMRKNNPGWALVKMSLLSCQPTVMRTIYCLNLVQFCSELFESYTLGNVGHKSTTVWATKASCREEHKKTPALPSSHIQVAGITCKHVMLDLYFYWDAAIPINHGCLLQQSSQEHGHPWTYSPWLPTSRLASSEALVWPWHSLALWQQGRMLDVGYWDVQLEA